MTRPFFVAVMASLAATIVPAIATEKHATLTLSDLAYNDLELLATRTGLEEISLLPTTAPDFTLGENGMSAIAQPVQLAIGQPVSAPVIDALLAAPATLY